MPCHESPARLEFVLQALRQRGIGELRAPSPADMALLGRAQPALPGFPARRVAGWIALDPANAELDVLPSVWPVRGFRHDVTPANRARARRPVRSTAARRDGRHLGRRAGRRGLRHRRGRAVGGAGGPRAAMALTRPPGHHAGPDFFGGYCFLNNAALGAGCARPARARRRAGHRLPPRQRHQTIFYERGDVLTVSVHGDPLTEYPFFLGHADEGARAPARAAT